MNCCDSKRRPHLVTDVENRVKITHTFDRSPVKFREGLVKCLSELLKLSLKCNRLRDIFWLGALSQLGG